MAKTKNTTDSSGILRTAAEPFTIHLEGEPYILEADTLKKQVDVKLTRKRDWFYPKLKVISMENGTLKLLNTHKDGLYEMTIRMEPDKLHISCSCGMQVETLCLHTYKALERLTGYSHTDYFAHYRPNGVMEVGTAHPKYFDRKVTSTGMDIIPKANLGSVYQLADKLKGFSFAEVLNLPQAAASKRVKATGTALSYMLMDSYRNKYPTFLLPCLGVPNKSRTDMKGLQHFISGTQKEYDALLTDEQRALNVLCYKMWQQAELQSGLLMEVNAEQEHSPTAIFNLWEAAMPLLQHQEFIYRYGLYGKRELKERPQKTRLERIRLLKDTPRLHFQLIDKGAFYRLQMKIAIKDRNIPHYDAGTTFFIGEDKNLYLLASLKDAGIVQWMQQSGGQITVFKEHFPAFEQEYLNPLRECYQVNIIKASR